MAAAKEKLTQEEQRDVLSAEQSRESGPPQQSAPAPAGSSAPAVVGTPGATYQLLKGDLVYWHQGTLSHFDDETLENKKFYLFFFSANWSPQGHKFTPQLVEYYNRVAPQHPEFEVIFFSADRSPFGMETYMGQANMPWPAVEYEKLGSKAAIQNNFVRGLPCLILVDGSGKVLSNSYGTEKNLGPETVLADLDKILKGQSESALAPSTVSLECDNTLPLSHEGTRRLGSQAPTCGALQDRSPVARPAEAGCKLRQIVP